MTLQDQYNLINEGKGNKGAFLKEAKRNHSDSISNINTYDQAVGILKSKQIINENMYYADLQPITQFQPTNLQDFEKKFSEFLVNEAKKKKEEDEAVKVEEKAESKHVKEVGDHNYDYENPKNVNNQIGQEVLNGIYLEVQKDPKITQEAAMKAVMKNLSKDKLYYVKEGQFGIEGLGYEEMKSEEASGDYKASGYSDKLKETIKESLSDYSKLGGVVTSGHKDSIASKSNEIIMQMMSEMEDKIMGLDKDYEYNDSEIARAASEVDMDYVSGLDTDGGPTDDYAEKESDSMRTMEGEDSEDETLEDELAVGIEEEAIVADEEEAVVKIPKKKNKKMTLQKRMSEIEKLGTALALEAKMEAIEDEINERNDQISMLDENESMAALMDPKKLKDIKNEIKLLERKKGQYKKMHEKASKAANKNDE
jgi:hypothetical protein